MTAPEHLTDTVLRARADARSRAGIQSDYMPYRPASTSPFVPDGVDPSELTSAETVAPGGYTHLRIAIGTRLRFDDPTGDACANVLLYNAIAPWERLNVADTVKIPWQGYLGVGHPLLSGDGRVLASIVEDTSAHHDTFCGTSSNAANDNKYGSHLPEGPTPSGRGLLLKAATKHGLTGRDLPPAVSFFQGVRVEADGSTTFAGSAGAGTHVTLIAELPLIVLVANVPHPIDPRDDYVVGPLRVHTWRGAPTSAADDRFSATPEVERAYLNSIGYAAAAGLTGGSSW